MPCWEEASVDNFQFLDREFGFVDKVLFGNLAMELGSSWVYIGILKLVLDILVGVLCSLTSHWHS